MKNRSASKIMKLRYSSKKLKGYSELLKMYFKVLPVFLVKIRQLRETNQSFIDIEVFVSFESDTCAFKARECRKFSKRQRFPHKRWLDVTVVRPIRQVYHNELENWGWWSNPHCDVTELHPKSQCSSSYNCNRSVDRSLPYLKALLINSSRLPSKWQCNLGHLGLLYG